MSDTRPAPTLERVRGTRSPAPGLKVEPNSAEPVTGGSLALRGPSEVLEKVSLAPDPSCASRPLRGHSPATARIIQNHARQRRRGRRDVTGRRGGADVARHGRLRGNRGFSCRVLTSLARTPASEAALGA